MGRTKQLITWQGKPLVAAAFDAVCGVCDSMVVVFGHEAQAVQHALGERSFHVVTGDADASMFESVRAGLTAAQRIGSAADVLLHPADHPEVRVATLSVLIDTGAHYPDRAIIPEHDRRGGHPALIPTSLVTRLVAWSGEGGLRRYWQDHADQCIRVPVDDPSVVYDIDTPERLP